jgi:SAM-dependent methyltransferase
MTDHDHSGHATGDERWLASRWPYVRSHLPAAPAHVLDLGCGSLGGFVPSLLADGYDAVGIDPTAPDGPAYQRVEFERAELSGPLDAVIASTSLHHVADPAAVFDRLAGIVTPGATMVVIEWAWERFDEATAAWCFDRLADDDEDEEGWLHRRRDEWLASGQDWASFLSGWAAKHGLHAAETLVGILDERLERQHVTCGPYLFAELAGTTEAEEQAAIDAGTIRATRIDWVGTFR